MELRERIEEILHDEWYDILDRVEVIDFVDAVESVVNGIGEHVSGFRIIIGSVVECTLGEYNFKVSNTYKGFVSCSDDNGTGVSHTEYYPYYYDSDDPDAGLKNLIEMMNEAWYLCTTD